MSRAAGIWWKRSPQLAQALQLSHHSRLGSTWRGERPCARCRSQSPMSVCRRLSNRQDTSAPAAFDALAGDSMPVTACSPSRRSACFRADTVSTRGIPRSARSLASHWFSGGLATSAPRHALAKAPLSTKKLSEVLVVARQASRSCVCGGRSIVGQGTNLVLADATFCTARFSLFDFKNERGACRRYQSASTT
jgi:hypothetical protein